MMYVHVHVRRTYRNSPNLFLLATGA